CKLSGGEIETIERQVRIALPLPAPSPIVFLPPPKKLGDERTVVIQGGGFTSAEEAHAAGVPVKRALMLAGVVLGVGIDVGNDEPVSWAARRGDGEPDDRLQPYVHGLQVVPELDPLLFGFLFLGRTVKRLSLEQFEAAVSDGYPWGPALSKKQLLAAELYNESHFHRGGNARFLTLVTAVEALVERDYRSEASVVLLDRTIETIASSDVMDAEKKALVSGIENLKRHSIGSASRRLVRMLCG